MSEWSELLTARDQLRQIDRVNKRPSISFLCRAVVVIGFCVDGFGDLITRLRRATMSAVHCNRSLATRLFSHVKDGSWPALTPTIRETE